MELLMKKLTVCTVFLFAVIFNISAGAFNPLAYKAPVKSGKIILDAGVGFGYGIDVHGSCEFAKSVKAGSYALPLSYGGGIDVAIHNGVSFSAVGRGAWHIDLGFDIPMDTYVGFALGILGASEVYQNQNTNTTDTRVNLKVEAGCYAGVRYFLSEKMGLFLEAGYTGLTFVKFGASMVVDKL